MHLSTKVGARGRVGLSLHEQGLFCCDPRRVSHSFPTSLTSHSSVPRRLVSQGRLVSVLLVPSRVCSYQYPHYPPVRRSDLQGHPSLQTALRPPWPYCLDPLVPFDTNLSSLRPRPCQYLVLVQIPRCDPHTFSTPFSGRLVPSSLDSLLGSSRSPVP